VLAWWGFAAAAAAVAFVALTLQIRQPTAPIEEPPSYRAVVEEAVQSMLPEGVRLPRDAFVLRWAGPEGARYDVQVATEDLRVLAKARGIEATEYRVPEERLRDLAPGARIVWQVEAVFSDGSRITSVSFVAELE